MTKNITKILNEFIDKMDYAVTKTRPTNCILSIKEVENNLNFFNQNCSLLSDVELKKMNTLVNKFLWRYL
ncbi:hypothetical protein [Arcobacter sp. FWKO B]|uniref:hypothetical protein n=1 Tax=Arcobacter sp. FWKO B TaxID=2593672 RepID=UPI0018A53A38|nr:hypothetical protein [Arcobacter sp. FWKO B]QOG13030.1 hypothetical protein FWKOB_10170 [Arcobacter sp. FWKO B]